MEGHRQGQVVGLGSGVELPRGLFQQRQSCSEGHSQPSLRLEGRVGLASQAVRGPGQGVGSGDLMGVM